MTMSNTPIDRFSVLVLERKAEMSPHISIVKYWFSCFATYLNCSLFRQHVV